MFIAKHFLNIPPDESDDIRRNLKLILSTKRGTGYFLKNFGLSDVVFRTPEETVTVLTEELKENIRLFEPRVRLVKINEEYDDDGQRVTLVVLLERIDTRAPIRLSVDLKHGSFDFTG
jgi:phage baseplate assembly protein W